MIIAYLVMSAMIILSILYLYYSVKSNANTASNSQHQTFSHVRRAEIEEEMAMGRLTSQEATQLSVDIDEEELSKKRKSSYFNTSDSLVRWMTLTVIATSVLGSVSLYEWLGHSKEVTFTKALVAQQMTPEKVTTFLQYRSRRYDRSEDWYYEATDAFSSGQYDHAVIAFEKALEKLPANREEIIPMLVEYVQAIFYGNNNKSSDKMRQVINQILRLAPTEATALGLKGVSEFDQQNYFGAVLAWQEAIRYNPDSTERMALLSAINKAREVGAIFYDKIPPIITDKIWLKIEWDRKNIRWQPDDVLLVYALAKGQSMPVSIQKISPQALQEAILLTNLDALMPTATLAGMDKVDLVVKLSSIHDNDLTKGRIIGIKENSPVNNKEIIVIDVALY